MFGYDHVRDDLTVRIDDDERVRSCLQNEAPVRQRADELRLRALELEVARPPRGHCRRGEKGRENEGNDRTGHRDAFSTRSDRYNLCMQYRELGRTHIKVSEVGFGAWAIGGAAEV